MSMSRNLFYDCDESSFLNVIQVNFPKENVASSILPSFTHPFIIYLCAYDSTKVSEKSFRLWKCRLDESANLSRLIEFLWTLAKVIWSRFQTDKAEWLIERNNMSLATQQSTWHQILCQVYILWLATNKRRVLLRRVNNFSFCKLPVSIQRIATELKCSLFGILKCLRKETLEQTREYTRRLEESFNQKLLTLKDVDTKSCTREFL